MPESKASAKAKKAPAKRARSPETTTQVDTDNAPNTKRSKQSKSVTGVSESSTGAGTKNPARTRLDAIESSPVAQVTRITQLNAEFTMHMTES
jgi:hypothetical protein